MPLLFSLLIASLLLVAGAGPAGAAADPWQLGFQEAASPTMERLNTLHNLLLWIIAAISLLVLGLLAYVCYRFRASRNPAPSRRTHNTVLEIAWTAIPVLILVVIAIPSFKLLYYMDRALEPEMTLKAIGHQWYWSYEYPDYDGLAFDAFIVDDANLEEGQPRLLATDKEVVLPVDTNVQLLTTATDVIHSWAVPAFGVKLDAIPGKLNESWFRIEEPGKYYGQCSELCGNLHGFMPIAIRAVPKDEFEAWVEQAQQEYARADGFEVAERAASE